MMKICNIQLKLKKLVGLLLVVLAPLLLTNVASAQDQGDGNTAIEVLLGDGGLSYEYNPKVPFSVAIANFGTEQVMVEIELVNFDFQKSPGQTTGGVSEHVDFLSENDVFDFPPTLEISPGDTVELVFQPKQGLQLKSGVYNGLLLVKVKGSNEFIYSPLKVTVPAVEVEILEAETLNYDYKDLYAGINNLNVTVHNKGRITVKLTGEISIDLVDLSGNPVELSFDNIGIKDILPGEVVLLQFKLNRDKMEDSNLQPGQYRGFILLTDQNGATIYKSFNLAVPSASLVPDGEVSFAFIGIDLSNPLEVDFKPLTIDDKRIHVSIENKGKQPINLNGGIVLENLVDNDDNPLQLDFSLDNGPVRVEPGQIVFLYFRLNRPSEEEVKSPKTGLYKGNITISAEEGGSSQHAALTLAVPSEVEATQKTYGAALWELLQGISRQVSEQLFKRELELNLLTIIFVVILLGIIIHIKKILRGNFRPGPVTLDEIQNALAEEDNKIKPNGLTIQMKDLLENVGLRPAGTKPYDDIATAMEPVLANVSVAPAFPLKSIIDALKRLISPPIGHKVIGTLLKEPNTNQYELVCEIINARTGNLEIIDSAKGDTPDSAVERAASIVYHHVMMEHKHVRNRIAPWVRFSTPKSIELYQQGNRFKKDDKKGDAQEKYMQAAREEPNNILIRLALIELIEERKDQKLETLIEYLRLVNLCSVLLENRYRLAANLTFVDDLVDDWKKEGEIITRQRKELKDLLKRSIGDGKDSIFGSPITEDDSLFLDPLNNSGQMSVDDEKNFKKGLLILANYQWTYLENQLNLWGCLGKWLNPFKSQWDERKYYWYWITHWSERHKFINVVKLAKYCTLLRLREICQKHNTVPTPNDTVDSLKSKVEQIVKTSSKKPWEVHYNAACFYSLGITVPEVNNQNNRKETFTNKAIKHLKQAIRDPQFTGMDWLFDFDPDIKNLRKQSTFIHWKSIVKPKSEDKMKEDNQAELDDLCYAYEVLAIGAAIEKETWKKHVKDVKLWTEVHIRELNDLCQRQVELWRALLEWAHEPSMIDSNAEFINITGVKTPNQPKLGCMKKDFSTYQKNWGIVARYAEKLMDCWDRREDYTEKDMHEGTVSYSTNDVSRWAEEAFEVWQALEYLAKHPLNAWALREFKQKCRCRR